MLLIPKTWENIMLISLILDRGNLSMTSGQYKLTLATCYT